MSGHLPKMPISDKVVKAPRVHKRKRVSRACDYCRARKQACDGRRPTCSSCSTTHQQCSYGSSLKRGLTTGYVRALELLWALVFTVVPNSRDIVGELIPEVRFCLDSRSRLVLKSRLINSPEVLKQAWERSGMPAELGNLLSNVQENNDAAANAVAAEPDQSPTLSLPPHLRLFEAIHNRSNDGARGGVNPASATSPGMPPWQQSMSVLVPSQTDAAPTTFPQNAQRLLDLHFSHTHCWLPIVQKHKMLELLYSPSRTGSAEEGNLATFWAVLALASLRESPDLFDSVGHRGTPSMAEQYYAKSRQLIPHEGSRALGYVQALLILSLFKLDQGELSASWHLIGQAVRICLDSRTSPLGRRKPEDACGGDDGQNKILLSCFVLDTIVSCQLVKPAHLRTADLHSLRNLSETGPDEWEPRTACPLKSNNRNSMHHPSRALSIFNCYVDVIRILNDAMSDPISSNELCAQRSLALSHWHDQLPKHCTLSSSREQDWMAGIGTLSPHLINLHLAYKSTEMFLKTQQGVAWPHGLTGTQCTELIGLSAVHLISMFAKHFGVSAMPSIFASYQAIGVKAVTKPASAGSTPKSYSTRPTFTGNEQSPVLSCEFPIGSLQMQAECPEQAMASTNNIAQSEVPSLSCQTEGESTVLAPECLLTSLEPGSTTDIRTPATNLTSQHNVEAWRGMFGILEPSEGDRKSQKKLDELDLLKLEWDSEIRF